MTATVQHNLPLQIIEKYDQFLDYIIPKIESMPRRYSQFRDRFLNVIYSVPEMIYLAAKTKQVGFLNKVDSAFATIRWFLRRAAHDKMRLVTHRQEELSNVYLAEAGKMLGAWLKRVKR